MQKLALKTKAWACYDCGKCTATCPLSRAGADYSPRRYVLGTNLDQLEQITADRTLYSCLTCGQCDFRCPVEVDYTGLILGLRELAFDGKIEPECPHGGALQSVMRIMAAGGEEQDRLNWLDTDIRTDPSKGKVFYWTGCTMYFDAFFTELEMSTLDGTRAALKLLNALGEVPVVSPEERCCGHDLLWIGDRARFEDLARHNVRLVEDSGADVVVVSCAECLRTLKIDYKPFFRKEVPEIVHISEYVTERIGNLELKDGGALPVTYQDPCRMSRHLGMCDPPRRMLGEIPGIELLEMPHSGATAICCAGGTWSNCDRYAKAIQVNRLKEARATGADVLVTACPKCRIHFRCAMNDPNLGGDIEMEIRDVAEIVAESLMEGETYKELEG